jgi:hypothetical protein
MQLARNTEVVREGDRSAREYGHAGEEHHEGRAKYTPISAQQAGRHRSTRQCGPYLHLLSVNVRAECSTCSWHATQNGGHEGDRGTRKYGHVGENVHEGHVLMTVEQQPERTVPPRGANRNPQAQVGARGLRFANVFRKTIPLNLIPHPQDDEV